MRSPDGWSLSSTRLPSPWAVRTRWGTPDEESDVDLVVVVGEADAAARFRLATRGRGALRGPGIAKDVLMRSRRGFAEQRLRRGTLEHSVGTFGRLLYAGP